MATRTRKKAEKQVQAIIAYKEVFSSEKGQEVLFDLCRKCHYFQTSYNGNPNDTIYNEGERNVVNMIMTFSDQDPVKLLKEYRNRLKEEMEYETEE